MPDEPQTTMPQEPQTVTVELPEHHGLPEDGAEGVPEGEVELPSEEERPAKRKKHRGPTKMKNIAKDPTVRERVDYNIMGDPYDPGSVKLSSYVGALVREHVPVHIDTWKNVGQDKKTFPWKSV